MTAVASPPASDQAPAALTPAVEADALTRTFGGGGRRAVDAVSFALSAGDCLALFGPNGAGKTTLLRMLGGLLRPTSGEARVDGMPVHGDATARARVGIISHQSMLYGALTARENVEFTARLYGVPDAPAAALRALGEMRVADRADTPVRRLSRGLQQRVSIARAMVHAPRVVLLDEPFTGLDELGARALADALAELKVQGAALVLVTHHLGEGLALATRVAVMTAGRLVRLVERADIDERLFAAEYRGLAAG